MTSTGETTWTELNGVSPELLALAARCFAADGGMPLATDPGFLRRRWAGAGVTAFGLRGPDGGLLAAGAVRGGPAFTGLVDPAVRGRGLGGALLDRGLDLARSEFVRGDSGNSEGDRDEVVLTDSGNSEAERDEIVLTGSGNDDGERSEVVLGGSGAGPGERFEVTVESETLTAEAVELFESRGLRQVFAEDVMRVDLDGVELSTVTWPDGATVSTWTGPLARRFHTTYHASFRDRPGFPGDPADEWIAENEDDEDFLPECSLLLTLPDQGDAGFVTAAHGWIVQAGVVPLLRRRGLAAALITESLTRMRDVGETHAWLTVNVDNPGAAALYRRLGFLDHGCRARFRG